MSRRPRTSLRIYSTARRFPEERHVFAGSSFRARLENRWGKIRASFWFIPALMSLLSSGLAVFLLYLDAHVAAASPFLQLLAFGGSPDGAYDLLSLIASSMAGIAGVTFSITMVVLTLASGHFGPRLLRNFVRDLGNQIVLGTYISTFLYCLLVLHAIGSQTDPSAVPGLSVSAGLLLALAGLAVLIYFIHHVSTSIQANHVIVDAFGDLINAIDRHLVASEPKSRDSEEEHRRVYEEELEQIQAALYRKDINAEKTGYIQAIDYAYLIAFTVKHDCILEMHVRPGDFLVGQSVVASLFFREPSSEEYHKPINGALFVGRQKTAEQDIEYSLDQLVEIAVRALSPGINDPNTAISCIDYLTAALAQASQRQFHSGLYRDEDGDPRVFAKYFTFAGMFNAAFHQIRQNSRSSMAVQLRLLEAFGQLAPLMRSAEQKNALAFHGELVYESCKKNFQDPADLDEARSRYLPIQDGTV